MARFCANCGNQMGDADAVCAKCGKAPGMSAGGGAAAAPAPAATGGLADNVAGMLAYITIIPAIVFLVIEPYNKNKFVRFHSFQCLFTAVASVVVSIALNIVLGIALPLGAYLAISNVIGLAWFVLWIVLLVKAYQGQMWKLPVIGDLAEKQAG